jgi:NAD(P)-dependent dehydrogenase (short-subunit alcohol dehydrogenase family)
MSTDRFHGRLAVITGAARGQGRSHALRLAAEGADVIAFDICHDIDSVAYDLATPDDLAETARLVRERGRRVATAEVDVRDADALAAAISRAVDELGAEPDVVLANAGIGLMRPDDPRRAFRDQLDVNLTGVWNTVQAVAPRMIERGRGGSIVLTSSAFGLTGRGGDGAGGSDGYVAAKHGVVGLTRTFAN